MINLNNQACCANDSTCCARETQGVIAADLNPASTQSIEILASHFCDMSAHSRVTPKRVTNSSRSISTGKNVSVVHSSAVTTTGSGSCPGVESLSAGKDGHAVFGFDLFDKIPANSDLFGWVNNLDTFIKDQNEGLQEQQVGTDNASATYTCCGDKVSAIHNGLNYEACEEEDQNPTASNRATGSELFDVGHFASFSQMGSIK